MEAAAIMAGVICGLAGSAPMALELERVLRAGRKAEASIARGLICVFCSFVMLSLALLVASWVSAETVLTFGCAMMAAFLLFWAAESLRALKDARSAGQAEGKEEK